MKDGILIGSLKELLKLKELVIDVTSLCGHQNWICWPISLANSLPTNLEILTLFVRVVQRTDVEEERKVVFENRLWYERFVGMICNAPRKLPRLRKASIQLTRQV